MKKITILFLLGSAFAIKAQTPQNVLTTGNNLSSSEYIGTNNNEDLVIKTNGTNNTIFKKNGEVKMTSLQGTGNRVLFANANGVLGTYPFGQPGQVLSSDGTWVDLPTSFWQINQNGNKLFTTVNKVGINMSSPAFNLDVNGDGHFTGNLVLNGELIINEKITSPKQLTTAKIVADSIIMDSTKAIYGMTTVKGDVKLKYRLDVTGDANFNGNQQIQGSQIIGGSQDVTGTVIARQGLQFDGGKGIKTVVNPDGSTSFKYGDSGTNLPFVAPCAAAPFSPLNHQLGGTVQIYDPANPTTSGMLNLQTWASGSSIDASINGQTNGNMGLLLNYFCGAHTYINTGLNKGNVYMGESVSMQRNLGIGLTFPGQNFDYNTALNIYANDNNMDGIKMNIWNNTVRAFSIINGAQGLPSFLVMADGHTQIGPKKVAVASPHSNPMLSVDGKIVAREIQVFIRADWWADYVFEKDYKLMPLSDVEQFYKMNKHLPDVPSTKEVVENGNNLAETDAILLRKIEENTIYLVEMSKKLELLAKENEELKKKIKELEK